MWLVWRPGSPDPSRPSPAIHFDDPAKDRKDGAKQEWLCPPILIAPEHRGMRLRELLTIEAYNLPTSARANIEGDVTKAVSDGGKRAPAPVTVDA